MATPAARGAIDAYSCAQCGAPLSFDPKTSKLVCDHCNATVDITLESREIVTYDLFGKVAIDSLHAKDVGARQVQCTTCGATALVTRRAERCAFCGAPMVVESDGKDTSIPPSGVLPFVIDGKDAARRFDVWLRKRWFAPSDMVKMSRRDKLDGAYLPFWAFDAKSTTRYDGERGMHRTETEHYTDSSGNQQTRTVTHTDWHPASGTVHVTNTDVLVSGSPTLPPKLVVKLEPWELPRVRSFDPRFLAGFIAERYRTSPSDSFTAAYPIFEAHIKHAINNDIGGDEQRIHSMNVDWDAVGFRHLLLPVWLSSFRYNEKVFHVAVNAATGEVVGERPVSAAKVITFVLAIAAVIAAIVLLLVHYRHR